MGRLIETLNRFVCIIGLNVRSIIGGLLLVV